MLVMPAAEATHTTEGLTTSGCAITRGGWSSDPHGHNPGALLHHWFDELFPSGLTVGDRHFDDAQEVTDFMSTGSGFAVNFEKQAVALSLNIAFGDAGLLDGTVSDVEVGDGGDYDGWTAVEVLAEAEDVMVNDATITGGEYSDLNSAMDGFNDEKAGFGCHMPPACPEDVVALPKPDGSVHLDWSAVDGATAYGVYRATGASDEFVLLDTTSDTSYNDTTPAVGQTYRYMITAWDGLLESEGCPAVTTTAVPFFGGLVLGAVALVGSVGAYRWLRRP